MIPLGPFEAIERVGSGAMGQVWRGFHTRSRTPVAIKLVLAQQSEVEDAARSVRREARAIASLQHPNVVYVYDQGELDGSAASAFGGVPEGSPYIVMELLSGGTLLERHRDSNWAAVRTDLERMLEGLAHCHARGVLHRDLKPSNVLYGAPTDPRPGLKLVDFGIAWSRDSHDAAFGTPEYCAPEQQGAEEHAQGPWTDLYAVGVMLWTLVTGSRPFAELTGAPLFMAKSRRAIPPLRPRWEVPEGLAAWLEAALAGPPGDRFQSAPDALHHLRALGSGTILHRRAPDGPVSPGDLLAARTGPGAPDRAPLLREPVDVAVPPPALRDAGLNMWMYRPPPLTGRMAQRVRLWQHMEQATSRGVPITLSLRGPPRSGRTRLGEWLLQAARENGGVLAWATRGERPGAAIDGLLRQILRIEGTDTSGRPRDRLEDARWTLEHHGADVPAALRAVEAWLDTPDDPSRRMVAAVEVTRALARERPVLLFLDDADRDVELVQIARALRTGLPAPVVVLLTSVESVDSGAEELPPLEAMRSRSMTQLVGSLLPLDPAQIGDVVAASGGLPGRAVEVLTSAFRGGRWSHGPRGIRLALESDDPRELPDLPAAVRELMERSAALGVFPDHPTVTGSFRNRKAAAQALEHAERLGLVAVHGRVISFLPGVRRAVLDGAIARGALQKHHAALGRVLPPESPEGALHRIRGGDPDGGFAQLAEGLRILDRDTGMGQMLAVCEQGLELWDALGRAPADGPWATLIVKRVDALASLESPELHEVVRRDLVRAAQHRVGDAHARLLLERASAERKTASRDLHRALEVGQAPWIRSETYHALAEHAERQGDMPLARYWLGCATVYADSDDRAAASDAFVALGFLAAMDGEWLEARTALDEAVRLRPFPGVLEILAATTAILVGDLVSARSSLMRGVHWATLRNVRRFLPGALVRLGLVELLDGSIPDCEARLAEADRILAENRAQYRPDPRFGAEVRMLLALEQGRWEAAIEHLGHIESMAWPRPSRVAVFRRVRQVLDTRGDVPAAVREALEISEGSLYALRNQWVT